MPRIITSVRGSIASVRGLVVAVRGLVVAGLALAIPTGVATASSLGPGWEITYDLAESYISALDCAFGPCILLPASTQQGGVMVLYLEDPDGDGFFEDGAAARIVDFGIDLSWVWSTVNAQADWVETHLPSFSDERADGSFVADQLAIVWDSGLPMRSVGEYWCRGGLCEFVIPPSPPAPRTEFDQDKVQDLGDLGFNINVSPPDALMNMVLDLEELGLPADALIATLKVVGQETGRRFCSALATESAARSAVSSALAGECIAAPEPDALLLHASVLVSLGLLRQRRRRRA